jgi:hypothetical protein
MARYDEFIRIFAEQCQLVGISGQIETPIDGFCRVSHLHNGREIYIHGIAHGSRELLDAWADGLMVYMERAIAQPRPVILNALVVVEGPTPYGNKVLSDIESWGKAHSEIPAYTSVIVPANRAMYVGTLVMLSLRSVTGPLHQKVAHQNLRYSLDWLHQKCS